MQASETLLCLALNMRACVFGVSRLSVLCLGLFDELSRLICVQNFVRENLRIFILKYSRRFYSDKDLRQDAAIGLVEINVPGTLRISLLKSGQHRKAMRGR